MDSQTALKHVRTAEMLTGLKAECYFHEGCNIYIRAKDATGNLVEHLYITPSYTNLHGTVIPDNVTFIGESEFHEARYWEGYHNYADRFDPRMSVEEFRAAHSIELTPVTEVK